MLGRQKAEYEEAKARGEEPPSVTRFSLYKRFTKLRRDVPRLSDYSFDITRYTLKYQADAWKAASRDGGFPALQVQALDPRHSPSPRK